MKTTHKIIASLAGATLLAAVFGAASFWAFKEIKSAAAARAHSSALVKRADVLMSELRDAEAGQRDYSLTGDAAFLAPYLAVRDGVHGHVEELRRLTLTGAAQKHLDRLAPLIDAKLAEMAHVVEVRRQHDAPAVLAAVASGQGRRLMDSIRAEMGSVTQIEDGVLARRNAEFETNMRHLFALIVTTSLFTLLFAGSFTYLIYRETQHRLKRSLHGETEQLLAIQTELNQQLQQANATLQISEAKLAVTLNSIGDAVIATDACGRVTLLNPLAERLTGWTRAEAAGRPVDEIFHIISQETRQPSAIPVEETLAHGTIQGLANHTILIARDGSECPIADSCAPIRDLDGQMVGAVLVFRDVTDEDAARQALRDQQFYTRSLIESNIDAIMTTDPAGIITDVNKEMEVLTGCTRDELIGAPFRNYFTDPVRAEAAIMQVLGEAKVNNYELTARARDGKETVVSYNAATFHDHDGRLKGVFAAARDITDGKRLDQVLQEKNNELQKAKSIAERANLAKSDFLSGMSHELRTPLSAILGFAQLIESGSPPPTIAQKRSIDQILKAGWYLLQLINEILDLALIESGKLSLSMEPMSLTDVMDECQTMTEPQAQKRRIGVVFPHFAVPCFVEADRTRVKQVVINLISNAIKYNNVGGSVVVDCVASSPGRVRICIEDTGQGLSPDELTQLFQPFNRLGQKESTEEGTGIGLVMCKRLIELMGGVIGVESRVGKGSVFWIELNLSEQPQATADTTEPATLAAVPIQADAQLRTLLYVEDNPAILMLVEDLIARRPDIRLLTARDGNRGIAMARAAQPDVIVMDINLPGISGIQALTILSMDPATAHIPVLALSANAMPRDIEKGLEAGFFRYLTKPIKVNEFMETLDLALKFSPGPPDRATAKEQA